MVPKILIIPREIVTADPEHRVLRNGAVEILQGSINNIDDVKNFNLQNYDGEILKYPDLTLIPGFIQTHFHLCQTLFRGLADDLALLDWLQKRIFPYENAHSKESLRISARLGIAGLQKSGTTTLLDMGTMRHHEVIFEELIATNMRAFSGKCMIDRNDLYPDFKESAKANLEESYRLAKSFHGSCGGRINYGFAPRFVLSCSEGLLIETKNMQADFPGAIYHSHSSENLNEINEVKRITGKENIEYFKSIGILDDHTVMAHCIHVNEEEKNIIGETGMRVAHCPSANLKLGSGIAPVPEYLERDISVSLGADGPPCNNNLDMFSEMRLASLIQKPLIGPTSMNAETIFRMATIDGAKALHIDEITGSIETGKKADLVLLDLNEINQGLLFGDEQIYSDIVYSAQRSNVKHVMIEGKFVVKDNECLLIDELQTIDLGKSELNKLINRA